MADLDLNRVFVQQSEKLSTLLDNVVLDENGNLFIDPSIVSRSESSTDGFIDVYLNSVLDEVRALLSAYEGNADAERILQYMEDIVALHSRLISALNGGGDLTAYADLTAYSDLTSFIEPFGKGKDEKKRVAARGEAEDLLKAYRKSVKAKLKAGRDFANQYLKSLRETLIKVSQLLTDLYEREKNESWIFPDEQQKYDRKIKKISDDLMMIAGAMTYLDESDKETIGIIFAICDSDGEEKIKNLLGETTGIEKFEIALVIIGSILTLGSLDVNPNVLGFGNGKKIDEMSMAEIDEVLRKLREKADEDEDDSSSSDSDEEENSKKGTFGTLVSLTLGGFGEIQRLKDLLYKDYIKAIFHLNPEFLEDETKTIEVKTLDGVEDEVDGNSGDTYKFKEWSMKGDMLTADFGERCEFYGRFQGRLKCDLFRIDYVGAYDKKFKTFYGDWEDPEESEDFPELKLESIEDELLNRAPRGYLLKSCRMIEDSPCKCKAVYEKELLEDVYVGADMKLLWSDPEKPSTYLRWSLEGTMTTTYNQDGSVASETIEIPSIEWMGTKLAFEKEFDYHTFVFPSGEVEDPIVVDDVTVKSGAYWEEKTSHARIPAATAEAYFVKTRIYIGGKPVQEGHVPEFELKYHYDVTTEED